MGDENPIRTLGDYSKPSHEGYKNTIKLPVGNNVVPLRFDIIRLVQNGCSFHGLWYEDPNQHLKDFLKLVDSVDLDVENRERTRLHLFQFSLQDQASNWLERLPAEDLVLYDNKSWNDPRDFAKPVKPIALTQDVPSTSDRRLIELENQVQCLMEHLALTQSTKVNKITASYEICNGPHDPHNCMEGPEYACVDYTEDTSSTNTHEQELGDMVRRSEEVKEQGKEEDKMKTDMEVEEVIEEEESEFETDEEVEEIFEEDEEDEDDENFNSFLTMKELSHHEWLLKNPRPPPL
ncbi:hypothetical protein Tco_0796850 [Tanacetum coccineum]